MVIALSAETLLIEAANKKNKFTSDNIKMLEVIHSSAEFSVSMIEGYFVAFCKLRFIIFI